MAKWYIVHPDGRQELAYEDPKVTTLMEKLHDFFISFMLWIDYIRGY